MLAWPRPLHPHGTREGVVGLEAELGPPGTPVQGFLLKHEGTRARFAYYLDRDVRSAENPDTLAALGPGTTIVTAVRHAHLLAADGRFVEVRRTAHYVAFRVRPTGP
jgi:hypothetical protein